MGGLVVLLFATLAILTIAAGDETSISHPAHLTAAYGPLLGTSCDTCHDTGNLPYFKSGIDGNGDSNIDLAETDVCDGCHSSDGIYNGVDNPLAVQKTTGTPVSTSKFMIIAPAT